MLPVKIWRQAMHKLSSVENFRRLEFVPDASGTAQLRVAIANYLKRSKGIVADDGQIHVGSISTGLLVVLCRLLLSRGSQVAVENPGYGGIKNIAEGLGAVVLPVPLDEEGMSIDYLACSKADIDAIYVTPAHHDPTGLTMSSRRRDELIAFAREKKIWIIEDDYDGYFSYSAETPSSLWSRAPNEHVIYVSTFWQVLYPLAQLSFCLVPESFSQVLSLSNQLQTASMPDIFAELILETLLANGSFDEHLRRVKRELVIRKSAAVLALTKELGTTIKLPRCSGGLTQIFEYPDGDADLAEKVERAAFFAGLPVVSTKDYYVRDKRSSQFLLNFSLMHEDWVAERVANFAKVLSLN